MRRIPLTMLAAAALAGLLSSPQAAGRRHAPAPEEPQEETKPAVRLSVAPRHGFRPLTITLSGSLTGVRPDDPDFCHLGVEWEGRTRDGLVTSSKQDPTCRHAEGAVVLPLTYSKVVTLAQAGIYQYRLILHLKSGATLRSNTQEIRVLDNP